MGIVSQRLRDSARGQPCCLRIPGVCNGDPETTVLCHLPSGIGLKGIGMKTPDYWAVWGCHACHDALDRRRQHGLGDLLEVYILMALQRTWAIWFERGLLRVAGDEEKPRTKPTSSKVIARSSLYRQMGD
jgi:hypothetical protein